LSDVFFVRHRSIPSWPPCGKPSKLSRNPPYRAAPAVSRCSWRSAFFEQLHDAQEAGRRLGLSVVTANVRSERDFDDWQPRALSCTPRPTSEERETMSTSFGAGALPDTRPVRKRALRAGPGNGVCWRVREVGQPQLADFPGERRNGCVGQQPTLSSHLILPAKAIDDCGQRGAAVQSLVRRGRAGAGDPELAFRATQSLNAACWASLWKYHFRSTPPFDSLWGLPASLCNPSSLVQSTKFF
jgi:hypothetical protein